MYANTRRTTALPSDWSQSMHEMSYSRRHRGQKRNRSDWISLDDEIVSHLDEERPSRQRLDLVPGPVHMEVPFSTPTSSLREHFDRIEAALSYPYPPPSPLMEVVPARAPPALPSVHRREHTIAELFRPRTTKQASYDNYTDPSLTMDQADPILRRVLRAQKYPERLPGTKTMQRGFVEDLIEEHVFVNKAREGVIFDVNNFFNCVRKEHTKAHRYYTYLTGGVNHYANCYITPRGVLVIPMNRVFNLRVYVFLYILMKLAELSQDHKGYYTMFSKLSHRANISNKEGVVRGRVWIGHIKLSYIVKVYNELMQRFHEIFQDIDVPTMDGGKIWDEPSQGNDESGDRIIITTDGNIVQYLNIFFMRGVQFRFGSHWTPVVEKFFKENLYWSGIITVANVDDELCMFYCLCLGLSILEGSSYSIGANKIIPVHVVCAKCQSGGSPIAKSVYEKAVIKYKDWSMLQETELNLQEFCTQCKAIEDDLIPKTSGFAMDVYMINTVSSNRVYPAYMSPRTSDKEKRVNLLMLITPSICHCFLIRNLETLFRNTGGKIFFTCSKCKKSFYTQSILNNHKCTPGGADEWHWNRLGFSDEIDIPMWYCPKCFLQFSDLFSYEFHQKHCMMIGRRGNRHVKLLPADKNVLTQEKVDESKGAKDPAIYFADFECCISPEDGSHTVMSYGLYDVAKGRFIIGYDIMEFMEILNDIGEFNDRSIVYFHNAMNYDAYFIIRAYLKLRRLPTGKHAWGKWTQKILMRNSTTLQSLWYICRDYEGKKHTLTIGDTCKFLTMSLDRIVESVRKSSVAENKETFPRFFRIMKKWFPFVTEEQIDSVLHKNLFPYKYFTSGEKLEVGIDDFSLIYEPTPENLKYFAEGVQLSDLDENINFFHWVCSVFRLRSACDYHNLYLLCDVMQISDVFLKARETLKESHKIDLCDYIGMRSATWHAFLRSSVGLHLELYNWTFYAEFFSSMTRGGVTSAPLRYAKSDDCHSIIYLDVNGLYPFVMQKYPYPMGNFEVRMCPVPEGRDITDYCMTIIDNIERMEIGAVFCVDIIIPPGIQASTDQFPFAPNHEVIQDEFFDEGGDMYSFMKKWSEANGGKRPSTFEGLVGTLYPKKEYGVHHRLLKWYIEHGALISKIHFYISFCEGFYLRKYVSKNIEIRNTRKDALGKIVYKLLGNALYGKTFESPFNHGSYVVIDNHEKLAGMIEEGNVASITQLDEDNSIVQLDGDEVILDKPTYIGACVTEMAKLHMYQLFYDKLSRLFNKVELVYTDTDSFIVRVEHAPKEKAIEKLKTVPIDGEILIGPEGGKIKSETGDNIISEVIALRSKVYTYKYTDSNGEEHIGKRAKGTTSAAQDTQLDWESFKRALTNLEGIKTSNMQFIRDRFTISTAIVEKLSLSANDGKRFILPDGIHTLAWGNPEILKYRRSPEMVDPKFRDYVPLELDEELEQIREHISDPRTVVGRSLMTGGPVIITDKTLEYVDMDDIPTEPPSPDPNRQDPPALKRKEEPNDDEEIDRDIEEWAGVDIDSPPMY